MHQEKLKFCRSLHIGRKKTSFGFWGWTCYKNSGQCRGIQYSFLLIMLSISSLHSLLQGALAEHFYASGSMQRFKDVRLLGPCEDFFEFSCQRLRDDETVANLKQYWMNMMTQNLRNSQTGSGAAEDKAKNFFKSCLRASEQPKAVEESQGIHQLLEKLESWSVAQFKLNLQEQLEILHNEYGLSPFFSWRVARDLKSSEENVIEIFKNENTLFGMDDPSGPEPFTKILRQSPYIRSMAVIRILGHRISERDLDEAIDLEKEFRKIMETPLSFLKDPQEFLNRYNVIDLKNLQKAAGFINWRSFFDNAFTRQNKRLMKDEKIVVWIPSYLSALTLHLQQLQTENPVLLDKFMIWLTIKELLGEIIVGAAMAHEEGGAYELCTRLTKRHFEFAQTSMIRHHNENPQTLHSKRQIVTEMVEEIRKSIVESFQAESGGASWLDEKSRVNFVEKVMQTQVMMAYPDFLEDEGRLYNFYGGSSPSMTMNTSDFVGNIMRLFQFNRKKSQGRLRRPVDKNEWPGWPMTPWATEAFSDITNNRIFIPLGILQPPYFDLHNPKSVNYGGLGSVISQQFMSHFIGIGSHFDKDGKFQNLLETKETVQETEKRKNCLMRQYSEFAGADGRFYNTSQHFFDNAADTAGLAITASLLFKWHPIQDDQEAAKSFFVAFTQTLCDKSADGYEYDYDDDNYGSLWNERPKNANKIRVLGTLKNSPDFSRTFRCPFDTPMNPKKKCQIF